MAERTFTFREGWKEAIKALPDDVRLNIYDAIIGIAFGDFAGELKPLEKAILNFIKPQIEEEFRRKEVIAERNRRNGAKHVAHQQEPSTEQQPVEQQEEQPAEQQEDSLKQSEEPQNPKEPNKTQINPNNPVAFLASQERKEAKESILFLSVFDKTDECDCAHARGDDIDWKWLREQLVFIFQGTKIPKPNAIFSEGRKKHIRARIAEVGIDRFLVVMKKAANSTFLAKTCTFSISLSWLVSPRNFENISEGVYDDKPSEIQQYISEKTDEYQIRWDGVVSWFNNCGLLPISVLTDERKYLFLKAYEQVEGDKVKKGEALKKFKAEVRLSDYLQGLSTGSKKRDFDWCFDRMNYLRILEGTYSNDIYNKTERQNGTVRQDARSATSAREHTAEEYEKGF